MNILAGLAVKIWELSLKPQAYFVTALIYIPIRLGGSDPYIAFDDLYNDILRNYFTRRGV